MQKQTEQETITIEKELLNSMISDIENLIDDIEMIVDKSTMKSVEKRIDEIKKGEVKGLSEKDFKDYIKKRV